MRNFTCHSGKKHCLIINAIPGLCVLGDFLFLYAAQMGADLFLRFLSATMTTFHQSDVI